MKISVDFELTPEEMRKLFGLPDVEAFQKQLMEEIRQRMLSGAAEYDPIKLFQPYLTGTMHSWDMFQRAFFSFAKVSNGQTSSRDISTDRT